MQFSEQWLRAYVNPSIDSDTLAARLTMAGLEVEDCDPVARRSVAWWWPTCVRWPGTRTPTSSPYARSTTARARCARSCAARQRGRRHSCCLRAVGAVLPGDFRIKEARMRGVESQGMLCSARELGLSEDHSGLMILPAEAPVGQDIRDYLSLDDRRFTIKLTPNRGDCLSLVGVAREVAAITGAPLCLPRFDPVAPTIDDRLPVTVRNADLCGRFSGA